MDLLAAAPQCLANGKEGRRERERRGNGEEKTRGFEFLSCDAFLCIIVSRRLTVSIFGSTSKLLTGNMKEEEEDEEGRTGGGGRGGGGSARMAKLMDRPSAEDSTTEHLQKKRILQRSDIQDGCVDLFDFSLFEFFFLVFFLTFRFLFLFLFFLLELPRHCLCEHCLLSITVFRFPSVCEGAEGAEVGRERLLSISLSLPHFPFPPSLTLLPFPVLFHALWAVHPSIHSHPRPSFLRAAAVPDTRDGSPPHHLHHLLPEMN